MNTRFFLLFAAAALLTGCMDSVKPIPQNSNTTASSSGTPERSQTAIAHTTEKQTPPMASNSAPGSQSRWSQSGDAIDTTSLDAAIQSAEKALAAKPNDASAKKALGDAYFKRAVALTDARQYASALGDYRRTLKYDPSNAEAKDWIDQIVNIYASINRSSPKEGEEPPPLPFNKPK